MAKHSTDVKNKPVRPTTTFVAELVVDTPRFKEAGLLKGTSVEITQHELNNRLTVSARDGTVLLIKPQHFKLYEFDDIPDMTSDDWDKVF